MPPTLIKLPTELLTWIILFLDECEINNIKLTSLRCYRVTEKIAGGSHSFNFVEWQKRIPLITNNLLKTLALSDKRYKNQSYRKHTTILPPDSVPFIHPFFCNSITPRNCILLLLTMIISPEWIFYYLTKSVDINVKLFPSINYFPKYHNPMVKIFTTFQILLCFYGFLTIVILTYPSFNPFYGVSELNDNFPAHIYFLSGLLIWIGLWLLGNIFHLTFHISTIYLIYFIGGLQIFYVLGLLGMIVCSTLAILTCIFLVYFRLHYFAIFSVIFGYLSSFYFLPGRYVLYILVSSYNIIATIVSIDAYSSFMLHTPKQQKYWTIYIRILVAGTLSAFCMLSVPFVFRFNK